MWQCTKNGKYMVWRAHLCRYVRAQTIVCLLKNCIYDPAASIGSWPTPIVSTRSPSYSEFTLICTSSVYISYIQEFTLTYTISVYTTYILECKCDILYCIVALPFRLHTANQPGANIVPIYKHTCLRVEKWIQKWPFSWSFLPRGLRKMTKHAGILPAVRNKDLENVILCL